MRCVIIILALVCFSEFSWSASVPVLQEIRAVELERQAQERDRWIEEAKAFYFEKVFIDISLDSQHKSELEKIASEYQDRFLTREQAARVCGLAKDFLRQDGLHFENVFCAIEDLSLKIHAEP